MSSTNQDPAPPPLRHRNPPINPGERPSRASLLTLALIGVGFVVALGAPSFVVSPSQPTASVSQVVQAFILTLVGVTIAVAAGMLAFRRDKNWAWLIITAVPAFSLLAGGAILAATKVMA